MIMWCGSSPRTRSPAPIADKRILCSLIQVALTWQEWGRAKTLDLQTLRIAAEKVS